MATRRLLADLAVAAVDAGLPHIEVESVGGVDASRRVANGEQVDLVFLAAGALDALAEGGLVDPVSVTDLVFSEVAVGVRGRHGHGSADPGGAAFENADEVRAALVSAERIGYSTGPSGDALVDMIQRWGLMDVVGPKLVQARPGVPVAELLAQGAVDLAFQQLSELVDREGVRVIGVLPDDCAIVTVFGGAVASVSVNADAGRELLDFFSSPQAREIARSHGFRA